MMMIRIALLSFLLGSCLSLEAKTFGKKLCETSGYHCVEVQKGEHWKTLFPNAEQRDLVKKVNRTNVALRYHQVIAVPNDLDDATLLSLSPLPTRIEDRDERIVYVNLKDMAFGAYDEDGYLVHWGPISGGKNWCSDTNESCKTVVGSFEVYREGSAKCASSKYPLGKGGAPMAYCMFFKGGYAMHAARLPGYHASHGCVRMLYDDAKWLNKDFVSKGTRVIVAHEDPEGLYDHRLVQKWFDFDAYRFD